MSTLVATSAEAAGANCAAGGIRVDHGVDADADGTLDEDEIDGSNFICNGADGGNGTDGADGAIALVAMSSEAAGANCAEGGSRVDYGLDDDGDGVLEAGEIDGTSYVCDADGADGLDTLVDVAPEAAGGNCADGGQRIDAGVDDDDDGVLEAGEIDSTRYVGDGADGADGMACRA